MQVFLSDVLQQRKLLLTCFDFISCFIPKGTYSTILVKGYNSIYVQVTVYIKALLYMCVISHRRAYWESAPEWSILYNPHFCNSFGSISYNCLTVLLIVPLFHSPLCVYVHAAVVQSNDDALMLHLVPDHIGKWNMMIIQIFTANWNNEVSFLLTM